MRFRVATISMRTGGGNEKGFIDENTTMEKEGPRRKGNVQMCGEMEEIKPRGHDRTIWSHSQPPPGAEKDLWSAKLIRMLGKMDCDLISPLLLADPIQIFKELITELLQITKYQS